jgi:hypothetical protein
VGMSRNEVFGKWAVFFWFGGAERGLDASNGDGIRDLGADSVCSSRECGQKGKAGCGWLFLRKTVASGLGTRSKARHVFVGYWGVARCLGCG